MTSVLAHHAARSRVGHVELVGHDLAERGAGALAEIGLADEERRGVVLTDDDPRIELPEVRIGIRARALRLDDAAKQIGVGRRGDADDEVAGRLDEIASGASCDHLAVRSAAAQWPSSLPRV